MTLGEGKRKVLMLLDEYSSGGELTVDEDIEKKMADFFDTAQKDMASFKRIIRTQEITLTGGEGERVLYDLPADFAGTFRIWKGDRLKQYPVIGGKLAAGPEETGTLLLEYFAVPGTIGPDTADTYAFEVSEDAAACLPFFVAAQQLMPDLVVDYSAFLNTYYAMRNALDVRLPGCGAGGVRQALFAGR